MYKRIMHHRIKISGMKSGFTLAEVLITLTVIGVIAALTIPALITNIQDAQLRTAWKKAASDVSQVTRKLATDNGGDLNGVFNNNNDIRDKILSYLSYTQKCATATPLGLDNCWNPQDYNLSGNTFNYWDLSNWSRAVLSNGMTLAFTTTSAPSNTCTSTRTAKHNGCAEIAVDVNGLKGPNTVGKDIYFGYVTADGSFDPLGKQGDFWYGAAYEGCDIHQHSNAVGFTCSAQYLQQ